MIVSLSKPVQHLTEPSSKASIASQYTIVWALVLVTEKCGSFSCALRSGLLALVAKPQFDETFRDLLSKLTRLAHLQLLHP